MREWAKRGQAAPPKAVKALPPSETLLLPTKPACTDCGSTTRKLTRVSPKVILCATDIRERKKAKRAKSRNARQVRVYGITQAEKEKVIQFQGGGCICAEWTGYNGNTRSLSTDHDHKTQIVRGVLCKHCNDLLGRIKDDPRYFDAMRAYLANPPAVQVLGVRIAPEG